MLGPVSVLGVTDSMTGGYLEYSSLSSVEDIQIGWPNLLWKKESLWFFGSMVLENRFQGTGCRVLILMCRVFP